MAPKKEEEQGSLGEDTLEYLILNRSLKWMKVENAIQAIGYLRKHAVSELVAAGVGPQG